MSSALPMDFMSRRGVWLGWGGVGDGLHIRVVVFFVCGKIEE